MNKLPQIFKLSVSEARWKLGVWSGALEASDEHLIGTPLGVIRARAVAALPNGQRFETEAIDDMQGTPWRPSTKHRGIKSRAHITDEEDHGDDEEEEPEESLDGNVRRRRLR